MHKREGYSLTKLISLFLLLLFLATVVLSVYYYFYFAASTYRRNREYYQRIASDMARSIDNSTVSARKQIDSLATEAADSSLWFSDNAYENMLYMQALEASVSSALNVTDAADAILILPRKSDMVIEAHSIDEALFLSFVDRFNRHNTILPASQHFGTDGEAHFVIASPITRRYYKTMLTQTVGTAYMLLSYGQLLDNTAENAQALLLSGTNTSAVICAHTIEDASLLTRQEEIVKAAFDTEAAYFDLGSYTVLKYPAAELGAILLYFIPSSELFLPIQNILIAGVFALLAIFALTVFGIRFISSRIHSPINELIQEVHLLGRQEQSYRLKGSRSYEVADISDSINRLLDELQSRNDLISQTQENLRELHLLHRESQLLALQSQVNPHFLYNTLECIRSLAQCADSQGVCDILDPMIYIYRYSASNQSMGTVQTEYACVRAYADIMEIRFGGRVRVSIHMDPAVANAPMPRMVLQPLVENAINHGYANTMSDALVEVSMRAQGDTVVLTVYDRGCGMDEETLHALHTRISAVKLPEDDQHHIGLRNVHQRIRREFGDAYGMRIESRLSEYTHVTLTLPLTTPLRKEAAP